MSVPIAQRFCGREYTATEVSLIQEVVDTCPGLSRFELTNTVCERLPWKRPGGGLKMRECRDLLEVLENRGVLTLPAKKSGGNTALRKSRAPAPGGQAYSGLCGSVEAFAPLAVEPVTTQTQRDRFRDLVSRYHYSGYAMPFGARLQYLVYVSRPRREAVGCVQFSSPAWRMKDRDRWIGWDDAARQRGLQGVVNNSRLLVLARIDNLASAMLSRVLRRLPDDWQRHHKVRPFLAETLVDRKRFNGGWYRAANWIELGQTSGRGRLDQENKRHGAAV